MTVARLVLVRNRKFNTVGSGYLIRPDLVLTARHVVFAKDEPFDQTRVLKIKTREIAESVGEGIRACCIWERLDEDLALLRLREAINFGGLVTSGIVRLATLPRDQRVEGLRVDGFPEFMKENGKRRALFAAGATHDPAQSVDKRIWLQVNSFQPEASHLRTEAILADGSKWAGMSGAAVLQGEAVVGMVVVDGSADKNISVLRVVPIRLVLDDADFCKHVFPDACGSWEEHCDIYRKQIVTALTRHDGARQALANELKRSGAEFAKGGDAQEVADRLLNWPLAKAVRILGAAFKRCEDSQDTTGAATLSSLTQALGPALAEFATISYVRQHVNGDSAAFVQLPAGTRTMAELFIAAAERREATFRPRRARSENPIGRRCLPLYPAVGIDDGTRAVAAICKDLEDKVITDDVIKALSRHVEDDLEYGRLEPGITMSEADRSALTRRRMRDDIEYGDHHYYFVVQLPRVGENDLEQAAERAARDHLLTIMAGVKDRLPDLVCIAIDVGRFAEDDEIVRHLRRILA